MDFSDPALCFSRVSDQLSCELTGEIATLNLKSKTYFGFTEVAATIWRELAAPRTFETLTQAVTGEYNVTAEQCRRDLSDFLAKLKALGLLEVQKFQ